MLCLLLIHVLLATGGGHPVYLQIRDAKLVEVKHVQLEHEISCVDLNPIGENPQYSYLAAVGMWTDITVRIFSLTVLELIRKETLGGETLAFCSFKYNQNNMEESETHFVRLLDHQTFEFMSTHPLDQYECGCPIVSCSFLDDNNVFYCVGTAYILPEENEPTKGRILVFAVEDGRLQLIVEKEIKGVVYSLNAFIGKLLAAINQKIRLYKWMLL